MKMMKLVVFILALFLTIGCTAAYGGEAQTQDKEKELIVEPGQITGELSADMPQYISVTYKKDKINGIEDDMAFLIDKDTKFLRRTRKELEMGDKLEVRYDEYYTRTEEGEKLFEKRIAKEISFLSPAPKGLRSE